MRVRTRSRSRSGNVPDIRAGQKAPCPVRPGERKPGTGGTGTAGSGETGGRGAIGGATGASGAGEPCGRTFRPRPAAGILDGMTTAPVLDREEYVEQAYFFRAFRDRLADNLPAQDILTRVHEELLSSTRLPYAVQFLSAELKH